MINKAFEGLGISSNEIYLTNIVKCRTTANQIPKENELEVCLDYLRNQVILVKPKIIVLLGNMVVKKIIGNEYDIKDVHGKWIEKKGILYMSTWNPIELFRDENKKIDFWKELKLVKEKYDSLKKE